MVPPGWQPPSPGGIPAASSPEAPSPTSAAGSKVGEAGSSIGRVNPAARHAHRPVQLALTCPCPASRLLFLLSPCRIPFKVGKTTYLPILNTVPLLVPQPSLSPTSCSREIIEASLPPIAASVPLIPIQWLRCSPLFLGPTANVLCPLTPLPGSQVVNHLPFCLCSHVSFWILPISI